MREALSQCEDVNGFRRLNYGPHAVCSMLQCSLVRVRRAVHVIVHNALNEGEIVLVVVHNVP